MRILISGVKSKCFGLRGTLRLQPSQGSGTGTGILPALASKVVEVGIVIAIPDYDSIINESGLSDWCL